MGVVAGQLRLGREPRETCEGSPQPYVLLRHLRAGENEEAVGDCAGYKCIDSDASSDSEYRISTPTSLCIVERKEDGEEISACEREYFAS